MIYLRKYGVQTTIDFELFEINGINFKIDAAHASGDTKIMKNEGAEVNTANGFTDEGQGYSIVTSTAEMEAARIVVYVADQGTKAWLDRTIVIETYGHPNAQHPFLLAASPANPINVDSDGNVNVGNLVSGSSDIHTIAESFTLTTGNVSSGSYANTFAVDQIYHRLQDAAGVMDFYYLFNVGPNGVPTQVIMTGRLNSGDDDLNLYAWNWDTPAWELLGPMAGQDGSTDVEFTKKLLVHHVGSSGADLGKVRLRFQGSGLTSANLYIDQILMAFTVVPISAGYNGFVWLDTINGTSGTVPNYNGTSDRPVNNLADAITIAGNQGLSRIKVANGSSLTFVQAMDNFSLIGELWTLALGGQSCSDTVIVGAAVSGTCTGASPPCFRNCRIGTVTLPPCDIYDSGLQTTITLGSAGDYYLVNPYSMVAGQGTPVINFGSGVGNTNLSMRRVSTGIEFQNMGQAGTDTISLEGFGQYILASSCVGGNLSVRGNFKATDNASGAVTVDVEALINKTQIAGTVWNAAARTLTSFGTLIADIWANATRTLTAGTKDSEIDAIKAKTDNHPADLDSEITLIKGALGFNCVLDDFTYDGNGKATAGNLYIYNSAANAQTHDKSTGLLETINGVAVITAGNTTKLTRTEA